jgi:hypothetical protein
MTGGSVIRSKASLLLFTLACCFHISPDAVMLAPLLAHLTQEPFDERHQPEYLVFADELTATVFKSLRRGEVENRKSHQWLCRGSNVKLPHKGPHKYLEKKEFHSSQNDL